jgi:hypothetical protein
MTTLLYSDVFWACLMVGSIFLLVGSIVAWGIREWRKPDIY